MAGEGVWPLGNVYCLVSGDGKGGGEGEAAGDSSLRKPPRGRIWCDGKSTALHTFMFLMVTFFFLNQFFLPVAQNTE